MTIEDLKNFYNFLNEHEMCLSEVNYKYSKQVTETLFFKDENYVTIWTNKKECLLNEYNLTEKELFNNPCYKVFCQKDEPCQECPLAKSKKTLTAEENTIKFNDNFFISKVYPLINNKNELTGFVQSLSNITQEKKLKEELKNKELKIDLFTNLSHELRTPLNLMHSTLQIIGMQFNKLNITPNEKNKFARYINLIRQNNYRLMKIVNNIMDLQKMDSGSYKIDFKNNDIVECVKNVTYSSYQYAQSQNKHIKFKTNIEKKIIPFDPYEIERVILNLISNAFKYTESGDSITVKIKDGKNYIKIIVKDTGLGIPEEKQHIIFNKFSRVDDSFYRKSEGSGLGLSIVKFIVELHNGKITLISKKNKGSKFIINLPVNQKANKSFDKSKKVSSTIDRLEIEYSDIYLI